MIKCDYQILKEHTYTQLQLHLFCVPFNSIISVYILFTWYIPTRPHENSAGKLGFIKPIHNNHTKVNLNCLLGSCRRKCVAKVSPVSACVRAVEYVKMRLCHLHICLLTNAHHRWMCEGTSAYARIIWKSDATGWHCRGSQWLVILCSFCSANLHSYI